MADADHMRRYWNDRARENANYFVDNRLDYQNGDDEQFWEMGAVDLGKLFELLEVAPGPDDVVLDVGCGVGRLLKALAPQAGSVIGIDVSSEMIALAEKNLEGLGVTLHVGDGTGLQPVADASVDGVVSLVVFQHIPDPQITLGYVREMGRVLRPGGWAAFQVSNDPSIHTAEYEKAPLLKRMLGRAPRGQQDAAWRGSAVTLDDLGAAAHEGGLEIEKIVGDGTQYCLVRLRRT
jgi:SAM-dependent methyltransferase